MDVLLPHAVAKTVEFYPPTRPSSATCAIKTAGGTTLTTPAVTVDPLNATIASVTDTETITITLVAGSIVAGRWSGWVSADGQESRVLVAQVDGTTVKLGWPVARSVAEASDTLRGARMTASASTTATATRGENYAIEWTVTDAASAVYVERQVAHVVRCAGRPAVDAGMAKACITTWWPDIHKNKGFGVFYDYARRSSDRVWGELQATGRYLHLLWNASDFEAAGRTALEIELAIDKLVVGGAPDRNQHIEDLEKRLTRDIERAISSRPYDEDNSGTADATEIRTVNAIALVRA